MNHLYIKCHKCGHVHETRGFYGSRAGQRCGCDVGVDLRKGSGGFIKCRAILKAENTFEAPSFKEAKTH